MSDLSNELLVIEMSVLLDGVRDLDDKQIRRSIYRENGIEDKAIDLLDAKAVRYAINTRKLFGDAFDKK